MRARSCPRIWEVEALHEKRLHGGATTSLERHMNRCAACRDELSQLRRTIELLRALPAPSIDEVAARRQRHRLLAEVHESKASERPRRRRAHVLLGAATVATLLFAAFHYYSPAREEQRHGRTSTSIVAEAGTRWSQHRVANIERVDLVEGELAIEVHHAAPTEQLIVTVPDGTIEDVGTRFTVHVSAGATRQIVVSEGAVIFRRGNDPAVRIDAPGRWTAALDAPAPAELAPVDREAADERRPVLNQKRAAPSLPTAAGLLAEANEARRNGDRARAIQVHRRLQEAFPGSREAQASRGILGRLLLDGGDAASALASFDAYRARGGGPLDESVLAGRASALERLGRSDEARAAWSALLTAFPNTPYAEHARLRAGGGTSR